MTIKEMDSVIQDYCINTFYDSTDCGTCKIKDICKRIDRNFYDNPTECMKAYDIVQSLKPSTNKKPSYGSVNKPKHYNREGAMECIDEMELIFGKEAVKHFCLCNWLKYRYRAADKNGAEDLAKSDFYIRKYKELCNER